MKWTNSLKSKYQKSLMMKQTNNWNRPRGFNGIEFITKNPLEKKKSRLQWFHW